MDMTERMERGVRWGRDEMGRGRLLGGEREGGMMGGVGGYGCGCGCMLLRL